MTLANRLKKLERLAPAGADQPCRCGQLLGFVDAGDPLPEPLPCERCGGMIVSVIEFAEVIVDAAPTAG
jgi:hypothetical protein